MDITENATTKPARPKSSNVTSKEGVVIILDVGLDSDGTSTENGETFLKQSVDCIASYLEIKLLFGSSERISLVLVGSKKTSPSLTEQGDFEDVSICFDLEYATPELIDRVRRLEGTDKRGDLLAGLYIAPEMLNKNDMNLNSKKIMIFSTLAQTVSKTELEFFLSFKIPELQSVNKFQLMGPFDDLEDETMDVTCSNKPVTMDLMDANNYLTSKFALKELFQRVQGEVWNIKAMLHHLRFDFSSKPVKPGYWEVELEIGPDLKIPVIGEIEIGPSQRWSFKPEDYKPSNTKGNADVEYLFGSTQVTISKKDFEFLKFKFGSECLRVLEFVDETKISPSLYRGNGVQTFRAGNLRTNSQNDYEPTIKKIKMESPNKNLDHDAEDTKCELGFCELVRAMKEAKKVALVRKVKRGTQRLILGVMLPVLDSYGLGDRLVLVELPFEGDTNHLTFPGHQTSDVTDEQLSVCEALISEMNLMNALPDGTEAYHPRLTPNPHLLYTNHCLLHRILNPGSPLPSKPASDVLALLETPASLSDVQERYKRKLREAFTVAEQRNDYITLQQKE